jgi:cytochrome c peroxidase
MKTRVIIGLLSVSVACLSLLFDSCRKTEVKFSGTPMAFIVPAGFPQPVYNFMANPVSQEGFALGRKLFYEGRLSIDGNYPCSSCHQQVAAFTTFEHDRSHGYNHSHTLRNAPGLANLAWYPVYTQDGGAPTLQSIYQGHITNPNEMAETIDHVISKLDADTAYHRLFKAAFGDDAITADRMFNALNQFVINLVSANTKYDKMLKGEASFTSEENAGYSFFKAKCETCHKEPLFTDFSFRNVGLELDNTLKDYGRMRVTGNRADSLKFRVPSLRNADLTSYYTHDGRYNMMRTMLEHYRYGVNQSATLDPLLKNGIQMTDTEEDNLVAFLRTLTDSSYINNPLLHE